MIKFINGGKMLSFIKKTILILGVFTSFYAQASQTPVFSTPNHVITNIKQILLSHPEGKGTVGIIPYIKKGSKTYILLGREDIKGADKSKAGKYCDLGGSVKSDQSFLDNMLRELKEQSMGLITPKAEYVLNQGIFLLKDDNNRRIIYALIPAVDKLYIPAFALNEFRLKKQETLTQAEAEKDHFVWLHLEEILAGVKNNHEKIKVSDIDGKTHEIALGKYFIEDFLKSPELNKALISLK
jgi:uncharacterized protein YnzC (UPF0291/DUF896 family)